VYRGVSCPAEPEESDGYEWGTGDGWGEAVFGFGTAGLACLTFTFTVADEVEIVFVESIRNWSATTMNLEIFGLNGCLQGIGADCNHHAHGYFQESQPDLPEIEAMVIREDEAEGAEEEVYYA
jgi:hypothetical protein